MRPESYQVHGRLPEAPPPPPHQPELETGWLEVVYGTMVVAGILLAVWLWAGATMHDGPARAYQCSVGNQETWVCDQPVPTEVAP